MAIIYNPNKKIFTLHTAHTTYQMQVDPLGYLLHLYYGEKTNSSMDYVLTYADRGFSGNPYAAGMDRTYSLDALPQEYPSLGTGDYRNIALNIVLFSITFYCISPLFKIYMQFGICPVIFPADFQRTLLSGDCHLCTFRKCLMGIPHTD
jgi:hypothetical protein